MSLFERQLQLTYSYLIDLLQVGEGTQVGLNGQQIWLTGYQIIYFIDKY